MRKKIPFIITLCVLVMCFSFLILAKSSFASEVAQQTPADYMKWMETNQKAQIKVKPGDVITYEKADLIRPFIQLPDQGLQIFPGMKFIINGVPGTNDYTPHECFLEATKKFSAKARLDEKGGLYDYVAGMPFPTEKISMDDPMAGAKIAWNLEFKWKNYNSECWNAAEFKDSSAGLGQLGYFTVVEQSGGVRKGASSDTPKGWFSTGDFKRIMKWRYRKLYFQHRADLAASNYKIPNAPDADTVRWKELFMFYDPYDVKGVCQLTVKYDDPYRREDGWMYVPAMRRVRRGVTGQRADSLLGTEITLDDFYVFAGNVVEWDWKYLGKVNLLAQNRVTMRRDDVIWGGPSGVGNFLPSEIRPAFVVDSKARYNQPYSKKICTFDVQTNQPIGFAAFDRAGKLWKTYFLGAAWSEDEEYKNYPSMAGRRSMDVTICTIWNHQKDRGTPCSVYPYVNRPEYTDSEMQSIWSLDYLRQIGK